MYKDLNDYELIYMVREDNDSFNLLYEKYKPLIYSIVKEYKNAFKRYGYELDDLMQLGYYTLYRSAHLYNIYSDSVFFSYLKKSIINTIYYELRRNSTNKREILNRAFSYDEIIPNTSCTYLDILSIEKKDDELSNHIINFKNSLEFTLSCVFELFYQGYKIIEIANLLEEKEKVIMKYLREIRKEALTYKYLFLE